MDPDQLSADGDLAVSRKRRRENRKLQLYPGELVVEPGAWCASTAFEGAEFFPIFCCK